jgi:ABC-type glycerol-3-phosphate transport system permease component
MATGFLFALIPVIIFLIFQRYFIEGLSGGIKE